MAKRYRLKEVAEKHGNLEEVIPPLVNLHGQYEAGRILGLSQATISNWLKANGYRPIVRYEKLEEQSA